MKVLLTQDVENVGKRGEIVDVSPGYGRNYLIKRGLAKLATEGSIREAEHMRRAEEKRRKKQASDAQSLAEILSEISLHFKARAGETDKLYGSITSAQIAEAIAEKSGHEIDKRKIDLEEPIRELGVHNVNIKLMSEVTATVRVVVEKEE